MNKWNKLKHHFRLLKANWNNLLIFTRHPRYWKDPYRINIHKYTSIFLSVLPFPLALTCVCGWWSNMSIWISWVEVEGVLDILLFCTIDLTFENLFSVSRVYDGVGRLMLHLLGEGEEAESVLAANIMATAASLQPVALHTGAPGF